MRNEIALFVVLCEMVLICKGFFDEENEKFVASLEEAYIQNVPGNAEDRFQIPDLFVKKRWPNKYVLYDVIITESGFKYGEKVLGFRIVDVSMLVENRIVLITDGPGIILHCQFSSSSSSSAENVTAQSFYNSIRANLTVKFFSTYSFNLVKVSKLVDEIDENGSLVPVSGDEVTMKIHKLQNIEDAVMLRFVIELNGRDEPPFLVFTSTNSGASHIHNTTDEMALEIWDGLLTKHDVFGYIIKFHAAQLDIFTHMFSRKFDELLSALSQRYFVEEMKPTSSD